MRCICCGNTDKWELVDQHRLKPQGMAICNGCGFVSYPSKWKSKEEIIQHYRKDYRNPPTHNNLFTGQRKLNFHAHFLNSVFEEWKAKGKKKPKVFEIGGAYGLALQWVRTAYPGADVSGTEITLSYRRNAFHEYGLRLMEDFDDTKKYDLIMSYKVAEHQLDFDLELKRYADCLTEDGLIYISVPQWFGAMNNFGLSGFDLEYYYDPNHINVWTRKLFESILKRCGLEIVKVDHVMYDSTYLCKKTDAIQKVEFENPEEIKSKLEKIKKAYLEFAISKHESAIEIWPDFPTAHVNRAEMMRAKSFAKGWEWIKEHIIDFALKSCPGSAEVLILASDFAMRAERWEDAIKYAEECLRIKPDNPVSLNQIVNIMREMAIRAPTEQGKVHYFKEGRKVAAHLRTTSTQYFREATDMIYLFNAHIPFEGENNERPTLEQNIAKLKVAE